MVVGRVAALSLFSWPAAGRPLSFFCCRGCWPGGRARFVLVTGGLVAVLSRLRLCVCGPRTLASVAIVKSKLSSLPPVRRLHLPFVTYIPDRFCDGRRKGM